MSAPDDYARRSDIDRLDRAVEGLREQFRDGERRQLEAREADLRAHTAEHKELGGRIDRYRELHDAEHEREQQAATQLAQQGQQKKDRSWTKGLALWGAIVAAATAWVTILNYLHGR